jgi:hypothetical protein
MRERPGVHIILHGLLPRLNPYYLLNDVVQVVDEQSAVTESVGQLGRMWDDIEWINAGMREVAGAKANAGWHYVDARSVFVKHVRRASLPAGARESTNGVVVEGVHVSAKTGAGMSRQAQSESAIGSGADADEMVDVIDLRLMPDGLHPNVAGYELWLGKLSREVGEIMQKGGWVDGGDAGDTYTYNDSDDTDVYKDDETDADAYDNTDTDNNDNTTDVADDAAKDYPATDTVVDVTEIVALMYIVT